MRSIRSHNTPVAHKSSRMILKIHTAVSFLALVALFLANATSCSSAGQSGGVQNPPPASQGTGEVKPTSSVDTEIGSGAAPAKEGAGKGKTKKDTDCPRYVFEAAVHNGEIDKVKPLLLQGCDVNMKIEDGTTPLHWAAVSRLGSTTEMIGLLVSSGAHINARDEKGKSVLMSLIEKIKNKFESKDVAVAELLLKNGAHVNDKDKDGNTPLIQACFQLFFWNHRELEPIPDLLFDQGADINAKNNEGRTALMIMAELVKLEGVKWLLKKGADVNTKDKKGRTALILSAPNLKALTWGTMEGGGCNTMMEIVPTGYIHGHEEVIKALISHKADVNAVAQDGTTALIAACSAGNALTASVLLQHGAKHEVKDQSGETALFKASRSHSSSSIVAELLKAGADINATNLAGRTALMELVASGANVYEIKPLMDGRPDLSLQDNTGKTALDLAKEKGDKEVIKLLKKKKKQ